MAFWIFHNTTLVGAQNTAFSRPPVYFHQTTYFLPNVNSNIINESIYAGRVFYHGRTVIPALWGSSNGVDPPFVQPFVWKADGGTNPTFAPRTYPDPEIILPDYNTTNAGTFDLMSSMGSLSEGRNLAFTSASSGFKGENTLSIDYKQYIETLPSQGHIVSIKDVYGNAASESFSGIYILDYEEKRRIEGRSGLAIYEPNGYAVLYWNGTDNWHVISKKGVSGWG